MSVGRLLKAATRHETSSSDDKLKIERFISFKSKENVHSERNMGHSMVSTIKVSSAS